ncbi:hypothetical protein EEL30_06485 [Brevibacillus laterosporus]|uniref:YopX protein domain-containing protein n=1 Tax=Brevibacillus laterosporus TaxID=1465 RepID=A0A518V4X5_BRELA|nr:hypothetical protein EEL30_06485 [Brevibacillus laterosporus]
MREIKFRAWDKEDEYMNGWELIKIDVEYSLMQFLEMDRFEIMQYTGLHDKNGKEIYEGDFVRVLIQGGFSQHFIDQEVVTSVMYIPSKANYKPFDQCRIWMEDGKLPKVEVIGNIYQNPAMSLGAFLTSNHLKEEAQ